MTAERLLAYVGPLTGPFAWVGANLRSAIELALHDAPPGGAVRLVALDTVGGASPDVVVGALLGEPDLLGVVGPTFSGEVAAAGDVLDAAGVPFLVPVATKAALGAQGWRHFFRLVADDSLRTVAVAELMARRLGLRRVGVLGDGPAAPLAQAVAEALAAAGVSVDAPIVVERGETTFAPLVERLAAAGVDGVFYAGEFPEAAGLCRALLAGGLGSVPVVGDDGVFTSAFPAEAGEAAEGVRVVVPSASVAALDDFPRRYRDLAARPPEPFSVEAYLAATLLVEADRAVGGTHPDRAAVTARLRALDREVAGIGVAFDDRGELRSPRLHVQQVHDGAWCPDGVVEARREGPDR